MSLRFVVLTWVINNTFYSFLNYINFYFLWAHFLGASFAVIDDACLQRLWPKINGPQSLVCLIFIYLLLLRINVLGNDFSRIQVCWLVRCKSVSGEQTPPTVSSHKVGLLLERAWWHVYRRHKWARDEGSLCSLLF